MNIQQNLNELSEKLYAEVRAEKRPHANHEHEHEPDFPVVDQGKKLQAILPDPGDWDLAL